MSEATSQTAACEQLLDYVYDMLDGPQKAAFEQHLATCARCQAEAASFGKVRQATAKLMPDVEPTANLTGALHAQLMHAAAQRKPSRGKLLAFPRKIVQHPAWAAAAMFVIVGGAITINALRGNFAMPTTSSSTAVETVSAPVPASPPLAQPVAASDDAVASKTAKAEAPYGGAIADKLEAKKSAPPSAKHRKAGPSDEGEALGGVGGLAVKNATSGGGGAAVAKPSLRAGKQAALDSDDMKLIQDGSLVGGRAKDAPAKPAATSVARLSKEEEHALDQAAAPAPSATNEPERERAVTAAPASAAPPPPSAPAPSESVAQSSTPSAYGYKGYRAQPPQPASVMPQTAAQAPPMAMVQSSAPPPQASAPARAQQQQRSRGYTSALSAPAATAPQPQVEDLHQRADDLVRANRCDDAVKVYAELDRRSQRMSPKERANYVRCLTATGRQQAAEQQLDELKADKSVTNGLVQQAEGDVQTGRRSEKPKSAKKSVPNADRALSPPSDVAQPTPVQAVTPAKK